MVDNKNGANLGRILKHRRLMIPLPLREVADISGISASYLARIERGERFPSASVLRKIAKPLGFEESELFSLAGYLSLPLPGTEETTAVHSIRQLDPYVRNALSQEPVEVQRSAIGILSILKNIAKAMKQE